MMVRYRTVAALTIAIALLGCKSAQPTSAAGVATVDGAANPATAADGASAEQVKASYLTGGTTKTYIQDPTLNMNAAEVKIPANWHFQGVLYQGGNCVSIPSPVFRATSPDGLSFVEKMPPLGWFYGQGPFIQYMPQSDCLPFKSAMSAQQFLKYLAATMKLEYLGDDPVPAELAASAQQSIDKAAAAYAGRYAAMNARPPKQTVELARSIVGAKNGTFVMKGRLAVAVNCIESYYPGRKSILRGVPDTQPSTVDKCSAVTQYIYAPEAKFETLVKTWDGQSLGATELNDWGQAWIQRNSQQSQQMISQMNATAAAQRQASAQQFQHDQAVRQQMHEQFMQTMQAGTDRSMARTQASMNARSTAASDWVDYALDRQTVRDPSSGQVSKVSSTYTHTWVDSTGKNSYQTNDVNANPNGVLPGNWTQQTQTHGDGTSY
jgi:hypothetical protein